MDRIATINPDKTPYKWDYGEMRIWLPKHKWNDIAVAKQLGDQYVDKVGPWKITLNSIYRLTKSIYETSRLTGVKPQTIWFRFKSWGKETRVGIAAVWTKEEDELLKRLYPQVVAYKCSVKDVAKKLKRTLSAVHGRAFDLGLTGRRENKPSAISESSSQLNFFHSWIWHFNEHPKGMLGKTHTQATKDAISKIHTGRVVPEEQTRRAMETKIERYGTVSPIRENDQRSWKAGWREVGGKKCFFRSRWEANYGRYLEFLKLNGNIKDWHHEPKTFWFDGIKRGCVSYLPDFLVVNVNGTEEWHEVKGWMDARSSTKIKRFGTYFPKLKLVVIGADWFKRNNRQLIGLIEGWEKDSKKKS